MDRERWQRVSELFDRVVDLGPRARERALQAACADDPGLLDQVRRLLDADAEDSRLDGGAMALVGQSGGGDCADDDGDAAAAAVGQHLGDWVLERYLGSGGMGEVYVARRDDGDSDGDQAQRVAVKRLRRRWDGSPQAQRFLQERRILGALSHPNIPRLIDHGVDADGQPWFALEYVDGGDLVDRADAQQLDLRARIVLFREVCAAVQHAHEHFVVHRDLKPANILVDAQGRPKVLDFGVAKRIDEVAGSTRTGLFAGFTPEYAAPEQVGGGTVSAATDVYALGVVLFRLLSGRLPYRLDQDNLRQMTETISARAPEKMEHAVATGTGEAVRKRLRARAADLRSFRRFVRGDLARIVQTALAKEPQRRYPSVQRFSDDLLRFLEGRPVSVVGDSLGYRMRRFVGRNRWGTTMAALAMLSMAAGLTVALWQTGIARERARTATAMKGYLLDMFQQAEVRAKDDPINIDDILTRGVERLHALPAGSELRAELLAVLLKIHRDLGLYTRGVALVEAELGPVPDWSRAGDANYLQAMLYWTHMRAHIGVAFEDEFLLPLADALRSHPMPDPVKQAEALRLTGAMLADVRRFEEAVRMHQLGDDMVRGALPPGDPHALTNHVMLAGALTTLRRNQRARALTEEALAQVTDAIPREHAYIRNMAALRRALFGEYVSAEALFASVRSLLERTPDERLARYYAETHAGNALDLDDPAHALAVIEAGIARVSGLGETAGTLLGLRGELALREGDPQAAAEDFAMARELHGSGDVPVAPEAVHLAALHAVALARAGDTVRGWQAWHEAQAHATGLQWQTGHAQAMLHASRSVLLAAEGRLDEALPGFDAAGATLDEGRREPTSVHWQLRENRDEIRIRLWRAQALAEAGRHGQAEAFVSRVLPASRRRAGPAHPLVRQLERYGTRPEAGRIAEVDPATLPQGSPE